MRRSGVVTLIFAKAKSLHATVRQSLGIDSLLTAKSQGGALTRRIGHELVGGTCKDPSLLHRKPSEAKGSGAPAAEDYTLRVALVPTRNGSDSWHSGCVPCCPVAFRLEPIINPFAHKSRPQPESHGCFWPGAGSISHFPIHSPAIPSQSPGIPAPPSDPPYLPRASLDGGPNAGASNHGAEGHLMGTRT